MDRRLALRFAAVLALGTIGLGQGGPAFAQSEMVLKAADVHPFGYPTVEAVKWMGEENKADRRPAQRRDLPVDAARRREGDDRAGAGRRARHGAHQRRSDGALGPELNVFNLPYLFRDAAHMEAVIDGPIGDEPAEGHRPPDAGLVGLCWMNAGTRNVYNSQRPVRSMEDLGGLKIRMMGNPIFVDTMNAMGGNGVSMGFDQLINGLQTGVVDGAENNYPTYSSGQHYRYAKYYSRTEHLMIPEILVFSKRIWEEALGGGSRPHHEPRQGGAAAPARALVRDGGEGAGRHEGRMASR